MAENNDFWYRTLFKIKLYEKSGAAFQQFINELFYLCIDGFQSIAPWGNWGDGGNDGWVSSVGQYYQIYSPSPTTSPKDSCVSAVGKVIDDFDKLLEKWKDIRKYYFVYNDRYQGAPAPASAALYQLKDDYKLMDASLICGGDLERMFMELTPDKRDLIVGGIPGGNLTSIDPRSIGELLSYLADKETSLPAFLDENAPEFSEKIVFNNITEPVSTYLRLHSYQAQIVDDFLSRRGSGVTQGISEEVTRLYDESKSVIPDTDENAPNIRYVWMVDQLIPEKMKEHPHSLKAYREAAQVIISKYFETCDAYEHPDSTPAT